ncbi:hypothetical protein AMS68_005272 [Peltaster fructicola]|uniref:Major facilitator superfamily (MFS) profile domain-containing protein n=1 Tax=Peltaster fructicola TaxID=286661 RepID=A0A6H0XYL5_9PEZI|nr:hypothetical protein AMS68_005272 [Peltaster fructicola]
MFLPRLRIFKKGFQTQLSIVIATQIAFILFGYDQGVFSGLVNNPDWRQTFGNPSSGLEGIIVSIYNLGAFSGCILTFFIGEKIGRRWCIFLAMIIIVVGALLQATSYSVAQIMVARYITGIGSGLDTSTVPMYQAENCDARVRGRLLSLEPFGVGIGIVISYFFDYGMSFVGGQVSWRVPIACQAFFAFVCMFLVLTIPESARWLMAHGRVDEATQTLCELYDAPEDDPRIHRQKRDVLDVLKLEEKQGQYNWSQLFKKDNIKTRRRVMLAYGIQVMNQLGGINFVVYYVPSALQFNVGVDANLALLIGGFVNLMFPIGSLIPSIFLDRLGRRKPMMWGSAGLAVCMLMISVLLSIKGKGPSSASIAFFFLYMLIFGASANCVPWVYVPEILPLRARAKGSAIGISANWLWARYVLDDVGPPLTVVQNFVVVMITPTMINSLDWKAYLVWMCTNAAFIPIIYYFYPETANLTLEEVDSLFVKPSGRRGMAALTSPTQPVIESLNRSFHGIDSEKDEERSTGAEHNELKE